MCVKLLSSPTYEKKSLRLRICRRHSFLHSVYLSQLELRAVVGSFSLFQFTIVISVRFSVSSYHIHLFLCILNILFSLIYDFDLILYDCNVWFNVFINNSWDAGNWIACPVCVCVCVCISCSSPFFSQMILLLFWWIFALVFIFELFAEKN